MQKTITVVGSLNVDLTLQTPRFHLPGETITGERFSVYPGGKGGNQAVAAARLGRRVTMVGCLGADQNGELYREAFRQNNIDTTYVETADEPTGVALIEVIPSGENRIIVAPGANRVVTEAMVERAKRALETCAVCLLQLEIPLDGVLRAAGLAKAGSATVILDPAPAPDWAVPDALYALCDIVTPNEVELNALTGMPVVTHEQAAAAARSLIARGARMVVNKRGGDGALLVTHDQARHFPGYRVTPVDTTAAGDSFNAGLGAGLTLGFTLDDAIRLANAVGALSTTAMGAQSAMPELKDALELTGLRAEEGL